MQYEFWYVFRSESVDEEGEFAKSQYQKLADLSEPIWEEVLEILENKTDLKNKIQDLIMFKNEIDACVNGDDSDDDEDDYDGDVKQHGRLDVIGKSWFTVSAF